MRAKFILLFVLAGLAMASCRKEGCMNEQARNYDPKAKKDCDCCEFEGSVVVWYDQQTSEDFVANDVVTLKYFINGELAGSSLASSFWNSAPGCGDDGSITIKTSLGSKKLRVFIFTVEDQLGFILYNGFVTVTAKGCTVQQL